MWVNCVLKITLYRNVLEAVIMEKILANLSAVATSQPSLAEKFRHYAPQRVTKAPSGINDLMFVGERFYTIDANDACYAQVQQYLAKPSHHSLRYQTKDVPFARHQTVINQLNQTASSLAYPLNKPHSSTLVVLGSGMGFHLNHLIKAKKFSFIILVEPDDDMLFHFMSNVDITALSKHCSDNGGIFTILQPKDLAHFSQQVSLLAKEMGYGLFAEMGTYRHYETPLFNDIFDNIVELRHQWLSTWGFFDDEVMGLQHSLSNAKQQHRLFHQGSVYQGLVDQKVAEQSSNRDLPVLVIGNGPSLDASLELAQQHQGHFMVVSCGSALVAVLKAGITPDIHVEMERSPQVYAMNKARLTAQFCQNTILFALNTVSPELTASFKQTLLFAKARDLGTEMLQVANKTPVTPLYNSNPTVTNFAVSACIALGFEQLILLGCDYGYKDPEKHHASSSDYYNPDSDMSAVVYRHDLAVKGNFGGMVGTDRIFNLSRKNVEHVLAKHPAVSCINCADGAYIEGTSTSQFSAVVAQQRELQKPQKSPSLVAERLALTRFQPADIDEILLVDYLDSAIATINWFSGELAKKPDSVELLRLLNNLTHQLDTQRNHSPEFFLFSGIARFFSVTVHGHINRIPVTNITAYMDECIDGLSGFSEYCRKTLKALNFKNPDLNRSSL
ncbi:MAG: hypothetical protein ACI8WB_000458 [Phenylobacterium sp.]|jgi:hypothetical protein